MSAFVPITLRADALALRQSMALMTAGISHFEVYGPRDSGLTGSSPLFLAQPLVIGTDYANA